MPFENWWRGGRDRDRRQDESDWRREGRYGQQDRDRLREYGSPVQGERGREWQRFGGYGSDVGGSWRNEDRDFGRSFGREEDRYTGQYGSGRAAGEESYPGRPSSAYGGFGHGEIGREMEAGSPMGQFRGKGPRGYRRSDDRIREDVCDCLTDDPYIDASNLEVTVKECEVTLSGTVNSREEKRRAEDLVERISGVQDVHNSVRVQQQGVGATSATGQAASGTTAHH